MMKKIKNFLIRETAFLVFLFVMIALAIVYPKKISQYPNFVDWKTILSLSGLIVITTALKESCYFYFFSKKMIAKIKTERGLAFFLMGFSMLLSTFMTNDITLFIVIPLTLSMKKFIKNDLSRFVILEALSVNIGSALTPIGNPQNLFIWHSWGISFLDFVLKLFPLTLLLSVILFIFVFAIFKSKKIEINENNSEEIRYDKKLFALSISLLILFTISISIGFSLYIFLGILILFLIINYKIILKTDWLIIAFFIVIFVDLKVISQIPAVYNVVKKIDFNQSRNVFLTSTIFSQFMSNVPASVFMSNFSKNWFAISYGVNLAGNGFFIGSLANVIALRMANEKGIWKDFHKYSIPYFLITLVLTYLIFFSR